MSDLVGVILVNYNGKQYNDKCIESVLGSTIKEQIRIIVVDNASTDGSPEELKERWEKSGQVQIICMEDNYGFSKANNEGIRTALSQGIETFLLLNNDTEVAPDAIEKMMHDQRRTGAIVVPKIIYAGNPRILWCAGGEFTRIVKKPVQSGLGMPDDTRFTISKYCDFANGCSLMLTKDIIDKVGFLDERFFLYYEDTEYSLRAREKGVTVWYCADAIVYHKVNGSTGGAQSPLCAYYISRNWLLCSRQHLGVRYPIFLLYYLLNRVVLSLLWLIQGKPRLVLAVWRGILDYGRGRFGKTEYCA